MPRIIIDTDPGVDDAIAILMALAAPSVEVAGLTVVGGNVPHARCLRNALALVEYAGRDDIPVFRGSSRPLSGKFPTPREFTGEADSPVRCPSQGPGHNPTARWTSWQANFPIVPVK